MKLQLFTLILAAQTAVAGIVIQDVASADVARCMAPLAQNASLASMMQCSQALNALAATQSAGAKLASTQLGGLLYNLGQAELRLANARRSMLEPVPSAGRQGGAWAGRRYEKGMKTQFALHASNSRPMI